ncbi:MAG: N-acetyltransferase [Candidatus Aenigmarchaeota archaeon]|nr:N-acetyltransferase [Candidatus Aenigmarchaeota archaeon]MCK5333468.1 N-acetyltransferase [Candidatus Aenigmarchaeota archaeon]
MAIRKAVIRDAEDIRAIIAIHAKKGRMLPRALYEIYEDIRAFHVAEENGVVVGCSAAHIYGREYTPENAGKNVLAEIKSLAVLPKKHHHGIGTLLVKQVLDEAKSLGVTKVFTLTYASEFFKKMGFKEIHKSELPQKIWSDCRSCMKFPDECDEIAMVVEL